MWKSKKPPIKIAILSLIFAFLLQINLTGAIVVTEKLLNGSTTNATSYDTATVSFTADSLGLCMIYVGDGDAVPADVTLTQTGQTWDAVDATNANETYATIATARGRSKLFRTLGAGAAASVITIDASGGTGSQDGAGWACAELSGIDLGGTNGSGAILQVVDGSSDSATSITVTTAARTANSALLFFVGQKGADCTWGGEGSYTEANSGTEFNMATPTAEVFYMYEVGGSDTTPTFTNTVCASPDWGAIAVEVKMADAGGGTPACKNGFFFRSVGCDE